jgi:hypothetical protein
MPTLALPQSRLSPEHLAAVMELIDAIHQAPDVPLLLEMLSDAARVIGADSSVFVAAFPNEELMDALTVLLACDPRWAYAHGSMKALQGHPWFVYAARHRTAIVASDLPVQNAEERLAIEVALQHGFASAYLVPTPSGGGLRRFGLLCLGSREPGYFEGHRTHMLRVLARALAVELHEWLVEAARRSLLEQTGLRPKDLALLALERRGVCTKEMSLAMRMSGEAIDSLFKRINGRLSCTSRRSAARRAAEYGLIEPTGAPVHGQGLHRR